MSFFALVAAAALALPAQPTQPPLPASSTASPGSHYLSVPLRGEIGKEITAPGVREAIRAAKAKHCDCIVFEIDTPGGRVADADAIARVMDSERAGLKYYAIITRAISAAVWPLSRMDRIFFAPGAAAGAAVAFTYHESTGQYEVDAKFNAAMAAEVSGAAESHGQSGAVYRAMMLKDARLFRWKGKDGSVALASERPSDQPSAEEIDSDQTVLAWTSEQAAANGFGTIMPAKDAASLGPLLSAKEWSPCPDPGAQPMTKGKSEVDRAAAATQKAIDRIKDSRDAIITTANHVAAQVKAAQAADPAKTVHVYYRENSGVLTAESQVKWRDQSDTAVRAWNDVQALLSDLEQPQP